MHCSSGNAKQLTAVLLALSFILSCHKTFYFSSLTENCFLSAVLEMVFSSSSSLFHLLWTHRAIYLETSAKNWAQLSVPFSRHSFPTVGHWVCDQWEQFGPLGQDYYFPFSICLWTFYCCLSMPSSVLYLLVLSPFLQLVKISLKSELVLENSCSHSKYFDLSNCNSSLILLC